LIFSVNMSGHFQGYARMISVGNQNQVCFSCKPKLPSRLPYASKQFGPSCVVLANMQLSVRCDTCILPVACASQIAQQGWYLICLSLVCKLVVLLKSCVVSQPQLDVFFATRLCGHDMMSMHNPSS
jgi:hypothetical protein